MLPCLRRPQAGLVAVLACAALPSPALASDGSFTHVVCANPDTGRGVVSRDGDLPDGTTNPSNVQWAGASTMFTHCAGPIGGGDGVAVTTGAGWSTSAANLGGALSYRTPEVLGFAGGTIYRYGVMSGRFSWSLQRSGNWAHIFGKPVDDACTWGDGCSTRGTPAAPWSAANRVEIGSNHVKGFDLGVLCDIPQGWTCTADGTQTVRVYGGKVTLVDGSAPSPGVVTGRLATASTLAGAADVDFNASDVGSGLYRVRLYVDGVARLSAPVHGNDGRCVDVNPANGDDYEFAYQQPCRASAGVSASFDTRELPEGGHTVRVAIEDAGGNAVTVVNRSVTIDNVPPPTLVSDPAIEGVARKGSGLVVSPAVWNDHGAGASVTRQWQRCRYDGSACVDVPGAHAMTYLLGAEDVGRRIRVVEIASSSEGSTQAASALTALVAREDGTLPADGDGIDNDGDGQVDEPGETGPGGAGSGSGGSTDNPSGLSASRLPAGSGSGSGAGSSGSGATGVNGEGASPKARLTVAWDRSGGAATRTLRFGRSATAVGRLVDEHDRPIRNAIVDVHATAALRGAGPAAGQPAVTGADGTFSYRVDGRSSSRTLRFTYRYLREGAVVADASVALRVRAAVRLAVTLRGAIVRYSGKVLSGPMPRLGKLVVLQGRVRGGRWQTFATRRARRGGTYRGAYRLKVRRPGVRLQFRARALAESGWPYLEATSRVVTRRVK